MVGCRLQGLEFGVLVFPTILRGVVNRKGQEEGSFLYLYARAFALSLTHSLHTHMHPHISTRGSKPGEGGRERGCDCGGGGAIAGA